MTPIGTGSQIKCAAINSINREEIQHVVCSGEGAGVNRVTGVFAKFRHERTSEIERG